MAQYYVEHSHEAIIASEEWEKVQLEQTRRKASGRQTHCVRPLFRKNHLRRLWRILRLQSPEQHQQIPQNHLAMQRQIPEPRKCKTPHLYEDDLKRHFLTALSELITDRTALLEDGRLLRKELLDFTEIENEQRRISRELSIVAELIRSQITENAAREQPQTTYTEQYNSLAERYESLQTQLDTLQSQKEQRQIQADAISGCLFALGELDLLQISFSEPLWNATVERVTVYADERLVFRFKNGAEVEVEMQKTIDAPAMLPA